MLENYKGVMIIAEQRDGNLQNVALELVGKAKELAAKRNTTVTALVVGDKVSHLAENLAHHGADKVIIVEDDRLKHYMTEPYVKSTTSSKKKNPRSYSSAQLPSAVTSHRVYLRASTPDSPQTARALTSTKKPATFL